MSAKVHCPRCRSVIPLDDVNVATDLALCRRCNETFSYAELLEEDQEVSFTPHAEPKGAWYGESGPQSFVVGATTRSLMALFLVPFMCVWSGFSLGGIYGSQIAKGKFDLHMSLFGIPFLLGTLFFGSFAAMTVLGKVTVTGDGDGAVVFTGIGPMGWRRRFHWREVTAIRKIEGYNRNAVYYQIAIEGEKNLKFGSQVKAERLDFMLSVLRKKWHDHGH